MGPNNNIEDDIGLEKIRQGGICKYYEQLKEKGLSPRECLTETKNFARVSERQTKGILTGNVQPTGKKVPSLFKYFEEIEGIEAAIDISGNLKKARTLKQIYDDIRKDNNLNDDEKGLLKSEIERVDQKVKKLSSVQKPKNEKPRFKSIVDAIKKINDI